MKNDMCTYTLEDLRLKIGKLDECIEIINSRFPKDEQENDMDTLKESMEDIKNYLHCLRYLIEDHNRYRERLQFDPGGSAYLCSKCEDKVSFNNPGEEWDKSGGPEARGYARCLFKVKAACEMACMCDCALPGITNAEIWFESNPCPACQVLKEVCGG